MRSLLVNPIARIPLPDGQYNRPLLDIIIGRWCMDLGEVAHFKMADVFWVEPYFSIFILHVSSSLFPATTDTSIMVNLRPSSRTILGFMNDVGVGIVGHFRCSLPQPLLQYSHDSVVACTPRIMRNLTSLQYMI